MSANLARTAGGWWVVTPAGLVRLGRPAATTTRGSLPPVNSAVALGPHWARPLTDIGAQPGSIEQSNTSPSV